MGEYPERPGVPVHVEAASWGGRPGYFQLVGDWTHQRGRQDVSYPALDWFFLVVLVAALLLAARNLIKRHADWRGALRLGLFAVAAVVLSWVLGGHHIPAWAEQLQVITVLGSAGYTATILTVAYLALEPLLRRRWPPCLTSLNRILADRWRDPLVGRDLLIGLLVGATVPLVFYGRCALPVLFGLPADIPPHRANCRRYRPPCTRRLPGCWSTRRECS